MELLLTPLDAAYSMRNALLAERSTMQKKNLSVFLSKHPMGAMDES